MFLNYCIFPDTQITLTHKASVWKSLVMCHIPHLNSMLISQWYFEPNITCQHFQLHSLNYNIRVVFLSFFFFFNVPNTDLMETLLNTKPQRQDLVSGFTLNIKAEFYYCRTAALCFGSVPAMSGDASNMLHHQAWKKKKKNRCLQLFLMAWFSQHCVIVGPRRWVDAIDCPGSLSLPPPTTHSMLAATRRSAHTRRRTNVAFARGTTPTVAPWSSHSPRRPKRTVIISQADVETLLEINIYRPIWFQFCNFHPQ